MIGSSVLWRSSVTSWSGALLVNMVWVWSSIVSLGHALVMLRLGATHLRMSLVNLLRLWSNLTLAGRPTLRMAMSTVHGVMRLLLRTSLTSIVAVALTMLVSLWLGVALAIDCSWATLLLLSSHGPAMHGSLLLALGWVLPVARSAVPWIPWRHSSNLPVISRGSLLTLPSLSDWLALVIWIVHAASAAHRSLLTGRSGWPLMLATLGLSRRCTWSSFWSSLVSLPPWASLCQCLSDLGFVGLHSLMFNEFLEILETAIFVNSVITFSSLGLVRWLIQLLLVISVVLLPLRLILGLLLLSVISLPVQVERLNLVILSVPTLVLSIIDLLIDFHL